ncbi:SRPBCC family protein [Mycobacterium fragae]|uniref:Polyketide cyclase n=1 Tax=Mycobacterium fragae TaxID=1260918 RepID=A0A1X1V4D9_9MYCO|nr:SRPBCC family protein [Mycobacterium fragae]MCV7399325.1 SRPBCC family protein [Mycobacterium fragae]ORV63966.1 hypothetical protein AWC06_08265 [Mycobacterium fragae]
MMQNVAFKFTEDILINAPHNVVWQQLRDVENWWPASNPEHINLEPLNDRDVTSAGARFRIRERIGGIPGEAVGEITDVKPDRAVTWDATARYRWLGVPLTVGEGVTWRVEPQDSSTARVSAEVWANFPRHLLGQVMEFCFTRLLNGIKKDREHARTELRYLKLILERDGVEGDGPTS